MPRVYCSNCGNKINDGSRFCSFCGNPVMVPGNGDNETTEQRMQLPNTENTVVKENIKSEKSTGKKKKGRKKTSSGMIEDLISFSGRMSNGDFWIRIVIVFLIALIIAAAVMHAGIFFKEGVVEILYCIYIFLLVLDVSFSCRRLHDIGKSGAYSLLAIIPLANIVLLIWLIQDGQPFTNQYGPDPKGREQRQFSQ